MTVEEADQLCRLYMDCQLSVLEETELEYVLMQSGLDSPLLSETRALMGISRSVNLQAKKKRLYVTRGWRTAACVAILIGCVALLENLITSKKDTITYVEGTEIGIDRTKDIAKSEATKNVPQGSKVKIGERVEIETTQAVSQPRPTTLSMKHCKRKTGKVRQKTSDMTAPQQEQPIIAETTTPAKEPTDGAARAERSLLLLCRVATEEDRRPTMPSTHIVPEHVVYIINGERQVPTPDMPSINDLRMRGQRLTTEVRRQIQEPTIEF